MVAGKLVRAMNGLEVPVGPEDIVLEHRHSVRMCHSDVENQSVVAVQI